MMWRSLPASAGPCTHCACRRPAQLVLLTARRRLCGRSSTPSERARLRQKLSWPTRASIEEDVATAPGDGAVVAQPQAAQGEDAAAFDPGQQSAGKWAFFTAELVAVLGIMYAVWLAPGSGYANDFLDQLQRLSTDSTVVMLAIFSVFALIHSGLAYLRPQGEALVGARAYRVLFAALSLPLATVAVVFFINHRYDGVPLWNLRGAPGVHGAVWAANFVSFFFLYPSTFNLLEVAAVDEPKLHMWETGVMRITRHPQALGQALWCAAHTAWIGSSFMVATSAALMAHHVFGCWHGDFRLRRKYGAAFDEVAARTSTLPFQAIWEGRQVLPPDYYKEWLRLPYLTILAVTLGVYWAHPYMQSASHFLGW